MEKTRTITIIPVMEIDDSLKNLISESIKELFGTEPLYSKKIKEKPDYALDQIRMQYNAALILKNEEKKIELKNNKTIFLLDVDLYIPIFTYVFGEARLGGTAAVVSTKRLREKADKSLFNERISKVVLHELGHLYNLTHCDTKSCVMGFSGGLSELDQISTTLCKYCRETILSIAK